MRLRRLPLEIGRRYKFGGLWTLVHLLCQRAMGYTGGYNDGVMTRKAYEAWLGYGLSGSHHQCGFAHAATFAHSKQQ